MQAGSISWHRDCPAPVALALGLGLWVNLAMPTPSNPVRFVWLRRLVFRLRLMVWRWSNSLRGLPPACRRGVGIWSLVLLGMVALAGLGGAIAPVQANPSDSSTPAVTQTEPTLPPLAIHPLPEALQAWQPETLDDYFTEVTPIAGVGYLLWSEFPVSVYIEPPVGAVGDRSYTWYSYVQQAVNDWSPYLPLVLVEAADAADITIWRDIPDIERNPDQTPRARSAETRYQIYVERLETGLVQLRHRMSIVVRPGQPDQHIGGAARHELGHALGVWGHSPEETDVLYYSQVRHPPAISPRDVNTLKRVYEQPTRLGWPIAEVL